MKLSFLVGSGIWVWDWNNLPQEIKDWMKENGCSSDDLDWIAIVPPAYKGQYINWLEEPHFGCCQVDTYNLSPEGHELILGYHS